MAFVGLVCYLDLATFFRSCIPCYLVLGFFVSYIGGFNRCDIPTGIEDIPLLL